MSRIRSIHPGLWTDEAFVSLSAFARLLFMGIWNECDDAGSFEWSPLKLKMRILPADSVDSPALLAELVAAETVMQYDVGGKRYGAVRNFCQYQRPKKPNSVFPQTEEVRAWVNTEARSTRDGGEAVGNQLPPEPENARQMEEGGGRMKTSSDKPEEGKARKRASPAPKASFEVPEWIPAEPWQAFVEMRREMERGPKKIPFTVGAAKGVIDDLTKFRDAGHDIAAILMKSAINSYRGVFAPDTPAAGQASAGGNQEPAPREAFEALCDREIERWRRQGNEREALVWEAKKRGEERRNGATGPPRSIGALTAGITQQIEMHH